MIITDNSIVYSKLNITQNQQDFYKFDHRFFAD